MEEAISSLKKNGWNVSLEKVKKQLLNDEATDAEKRFLREPERWILNEDIKNVCTPSLPDGLNSGRVTQVSTPIVLQVKKIEIISAPKQNVDSEAAPRMLKIALSDGKTICHGVEFEHIQKLSLATPPGTKIRLIGTVKVWNGLILLDAKNLHFLGGEVPDLIEDWKVQQLLLGHVRAQDRDGPPPWVPFGRRIQPLNIVDGKDKKTLDEKENVVKDEEFLNQRQDAIAAASDASGVTKVIKGSGRQLEMQHAERRGRGRGERRERTSYRDDERSAKPRDSIRLFEFLQPQIATEPQKEEDEYSDVAGDDYAELEDRPTWERDSGYRPGRGGGARARGSFQDDNSYNRGRRGSHRGRGSSDDSYRDRRGSHRGRGSHDDSYRGDRRESYRGRGSHQEQDWRGVRPSFRGSSDQEQAYGSNRGYQDRRGSSRGGGRRGSHRDIEDSYSNPRQYQSSSSRRSPVDVLADDFGAWPGLDTKPAQPSAQVEIRAPKVQQDQWAVEDFCLAKWESSDKHYPAVVQQLHPARKAATVMFVESGAIRIVETKFLRRDPQDEGNQPSYNSHRGSSGGRIYTPRNRGMRGGGGW